MTTQAAGPPVRRRPSNFACKQVMAVTGLAFGLFVLVHMLGNLKAYLGRRSDRPGWTRQPPLGRL
jgi:hypothetical protein